MTLARLPWNHFQMTERMNSAECDAGRHAAGKDQRYHRDVCMTVVAVLNAANLGIDLARTEPRMIVHAFVSDWRTVDSLREQMFAEDLSDRVSVRVIDSLPLIDLRDYDLVLVDADHRDWLLGIHHRGVALTEVC